MKKSNKLLTFAFLSIFTTGASHAGMQKELGKMWNSIGGESVANESYYYKGQKSSHFTGGTSYFLRKSDNVPIVSIDPPTLDMNPENCILGGGVGFGGMSVINGKALRGKVQDVAKGAGLTLAYLGLSAVSPVIGETVQEVISKMQGLSNLFTRNCTLSQHAVAIAGDLIGLRSEKVKSLTTKYKTQVGIKTDYASAMRDFPSGSNAAMKELAAKDERFQFEDINIAWKALSKLKGVDYETKLLMMTMSGTIIVKAPKTDKDLPHFRYISSEIDNPQKLTALLKGGNVKLVTCASYSGGKLEFLGSKGSGKCLTTGKKHISISREKSFEGKVSKYFEDIASSLKNDEETPMNVQVFLSKSGIAAYRMADIAYQYTSGNPEYISGNLIGHVSWGILVNYLGDMLREVTEATNHLQISSPELKKFKDSLIQTRRTLLELNKNNLQKESVLLQFQKRFEYLEEKQARNTVSIFTSL